MNCQPGWFYETKWMWMECYECNWTSYIWNWNVTQPVQMEQYVNQYQYHTNITNTTRTTTDTHTHTHWHTHTTHTHTCTTTTHLYTYDTHTQSHQCNSTGSMMLIASLSQQRTTSIIEKDTVTPVPDTHNPRTAIESREGRGGNKEMRLQHSRYGAAKPIGQWQLESVESRGEEDESTVEIHFNHTADVLTRSCMWLGTHFIFHHTNGKWENWQDRWTERSKSQVTDGNIFRHNGNCATQYINGVTNLDNIYQLHLSKPHA